ncbi:hypothetical protein QCA50_014327 [Cerrena zonata]|uniref:OPT oligopeptide transporter n=1 Tax=Cerrena zonata TaxID=2478898 RepID=A0AAW0FZ10_9APHY
MNSWPIILCFEISAILRFFFPLGTMSSHKENQTATDPEEQGRVTWSRIELSLPVHNVLPFDPNWDAEKFCFDDSPYPEVRSAVSNTDDPLMPVNTIRAWLIGIIWAMLLPGLNQFLFFRFPSIIVSNVVAQLTSLPAGRLWERFLPNMKIFGISLNPGPFNIKEHVLITMMATVGYQAAYATRLVAVQRFFYGQTLNFSYQWMLVMSTQLIGFSLGGLARRFLVKPPSMIWPTNLVNCALFNTLHSKTYPGIGNRGGLSRERFFLFAFLASGIWYLFPGYLFTALSYFSWVCWIAPQNVVVNQLFGYMSGLGMSVLTFDWTQIAYIGSPLATPWWVIVNVGSSFVFFYWFITPILYYTNTWYAKFMPIVSVTSFDNSGKVYNVTEILTPQATLDIAKYESYSPLFLSTAFAMLYGLNFAATTATLTHVILFYRDQLWEQARRSLRAYGNSDIHGRLMSVYDQVPDLWYIVIFIVAFIFGMVCIELWDSQMPVWGFLLALVIGFIFTVPIGIIQAVTNQPIGLNVITELIAGYILPGKPIAMMMFKTWGYLTAEQAVQFSSDFKLGHYMKIPPRSMFWAQTIATIVAGTVQLGVQTWMFANIDDICTPGQKDGFTCPGMEVFGTSSIIWGVIGPSRQFSRGQIYTGLLYFFPLGVIAPTITYLILRKWPNSMVKYINFPIFFLGAAAWVPPASGVNFIPWTIVGYVFNHVIRRRYFGWWTKYNYVLSAALDAGVAVSGVLIYFCFQYPSHGTIGKSTIGQWWGNTVHLNTADARGAALLTSDSPFGPKHW